MSKFSLFSLSMLMTLGLSACGDGKSPVTKATPPDSTTPDSFAHAVDEETTGPAVEFHEGREPYATDWNCERALWGVRNGLGGDPFAQMGSFDFAASADEGSMLVPKRLQGAKLRYVSDANGYYQFTIPDNVTKLKVTAKGHNGILYLKLSRQGDTYGIAEGEVAADFTEVEATPINDEGARIFSLWSSMSLLYEIKSKLVDPAQSASISKDSLQSALKICQEVQNYKVEGSPETTFSLSKKVEELRTTYSALGL